MFEQLKRENPLSEVITKTWSELGKPVKELTMLKVLAQADKIEEELHSSSSSAFFLPAQNMEYRNAHYRETLDYFEQFIPKSIETIESVQDSREWFYTVAPRNIGSIKLNFSIKADGFNISLFYYKGYFIGARTRGRSGTAEDVTIAMSKVVPLRIQLTETFIRIKVEAVMAKDSLEILRKMDPTREWESPRNSIRTLLINDIGEEFNKFIIPLAFKVEGKHFDTLEEEFRYLGLNGFKVTDNETIEIKSNDELLNAVKRFGDMELIYSNDGCVVTIDETTQYNEHDTAVNMTLQ